MKGRTDEPLAPMSAADRPEEHTRSFFHLVETDPPTREQFLSHYERGLAPPNASPRQIDLHKGVSMFETEQQARKLAAEIRKRYDHVAEVAVPEGVRAERQGRRAGHHNVYASPDDLLSWVVRVVPVRLPSGREGR